MTPSPTTTIARPATRWSLTGTNIGDELNARDELGLVPGRVPADDQLCPSDRVARSQRALIPDQFKGKFAQPPASDQGICNAVHPVGAAIGGTGGTLPGPTNYGNKDDYIPHHEPFNYYASTANPHHLPLPSLAAVGTDTQTITGGVPQFNTANHQYDISDFNCAAGSDQPRLPFAQTPPRRKSQRSQRQSERGGPLWT